jgi:acetyltransferase
VIVGASDRPGSWAHRVWRNLNRYEFPGPIYLVNPRRETIYDKPCFPDVKSLPEPPDHLVVLVPAAGVIETLGSAKMRLAICAVNSTSVRAHPGSLDS